MPNLFDLLHEGQKTVAEKILTLAYPEIALVCGRLWGKDTIEIPSASYLCRHGYQIGIFCHSFADCKKIFDKIRAIDRNGVFEYRYSSPLRIKHPTSGGTIEFYTYSDADKLRGKNFFDIVFLNEASLMPDKDFHAVIQPLSNSLKMIVYVGTAAPVDWFQAKFEAGQKPNKQIWSYRAPSSQNARINTPEKLAAAKASMPPDLYAQEYECEFVAANGAAFSNTESLFVLDTMARPTETNYFGVDVGMQSDYFVIIGLNQRGELIYYERMLRVGYPEANARTINALKNFKGFCFIEINGTGRPVYDNVLDGLGRNTKMEIFAYDESKKDDRRDAWGALFTSISLGEIKVPKTMIDLREELAKMTYNRLPSGDIKYEAKAGFHDDIVDALKLANFARVRFR